MWLGVAAGDAQAVLDGRGDPDKEDEVHTFFSRDAGLTWQMARRGSHIYEYGDHGAIIVVADDRKASKSVYYSWDEAMTWNELHFTNEPAEIENIVIEPQATSQVFVMYGSRGAAGVLRMTRAAMPAV